jgi:transcriptional regulator
MARANPQWRSFGEAEILAIFQGPNAYVSPAWYGSAPHVPTWNYVAIHAYGIPRLVEEEAALSALVAATAERYEPAGSGWRFEGLPEEFRRELLRAIVGFELPIARLEGKLKLSQNRTQSERAGVIAALLQSPSPQERELGALMAAREG